MKGMIQKMYDLLKRRRSIRKFEKRKIEQEKVDIILKSALLSPSSKSRNPWEFIVVDDEGVLEELSKCKDHGSKFLKGAPLGVVILADPEKSDVWVEDTSIASIIIQLAAESLGLGSCWIQIRERLSGDGERSEEYCKRILSIPDKFRVESIIAIGYRAEEKKPHDEEKLDYHKIHYNTY
jgi:nitroreductase